MHFIMGCGRGVGGEGRAGQPARHRRRAIPTGNDAGVAGLLLCEYVGVSSRVIERMPLENVAVGVLCAKVTIPYHDTICAFRRNNGKLLAEGFAQVLEMAARCGVLKVGGVTVVIDGRKILAKREQACGGELRARRRADEGVGGGDRGVACEGGGCRWGALGRWVEDSR